MSAELPEYIAVGFVKKAHGVDGQIAVQPLTDYPPRFKQLAAVQVEMPTGDVSWHEIEHVSCREDRVFLKLRGVNSREQAATLKGAYLNIPRTEALPLKEGEFYFFEVIGFQVVTRQGRRVGAIVEVLDMPANAVLRVVKDGREHLIPVIPDVMVEVDRKGETIVIDPLDGLLEPE